MLPCEVKGGVPYLRTGENDRPIAAVDHDLGSDVLVKRRAGGLGDYRVIVGVIPPRSDNDAGQGLPFSEGVVTSSEVHSPNVGICDYVLREGLTAFVNAQHTKRRTQGDAAHLSLPVAMGTTCRAAPTCQHCPR